METRTPPIVNWVDISTPNVQEAREERPSAVHPGNVTAFFLFMKDLLGATPGQETTHLWLPGLKHPLFPLGYSLLHILDPRAQPPMPATYL